MSRILYEMDQTNSRSPNSQKRQSAIHGLGKEWTTLSRVGGGTSTYSILHSPVTKVSRQVVRSLVYMTEGLPAYQYCYHMSCAGTGYWGYSFRRAEAGEIGLGVGYLCVGVNTIWLLASYAS